MKIKFCRNQWLWCWFLLPMGCTQKMDQPLILQAPAGQNEIRAVMGDKGGELAFEDGAKLVVEEGLLQEQVAIAFRQEEPTFDLAGKDFVGKAYRISPLLTFAPGAAKLIVPIDRELPGPAKDINLKMYHYAKSYSDGPAGSSFVHTWVPQPMVRFLGYSQDQKHLVFLLQQTISERTTRSPYGLSQVAFDLR